MPISPQSVLKEPLSLTDVVSSVDALVAAQLAARVLDANSHPCQELIERSTSEQSLPHQQMLDINKITTDSSPCIRRYLDQAFMSETISYHGIAGMFSSTKIFCGALTAQLPSLTGTGAWYPTLRGLDVHLIFGILETAVLAGMESKRPSSA